MEASTPLTWLELSARALPGGHATEAYGQAREQVLEWSRPVGPGPFPVAILVHGGCWLNRFDRGYCRHLAAALRERGWLAVNVEYRRVGDPGGGWPGTAEDVAAAVRFVLGQAGAWGWDGTVVTMVGHSAGGHLALLAAAEPRVNTVVGLAAITHLGRYVTEPMDCAEGARRLVGGGAVPPAADPGQQPLPGANVILVSGDCDRIVPTSYGETFAARGPSVNHQVIPGAGHFDLVAPWTTAGALVVDLIDGTRGVRS